MLGLLPQRMLGGGGGGAMFSSPCCRWTSSLVVMVTGCLLLLPDVVHGTDPTPSAATCGTTARPIPAELRLLRCLMENYDPAIRPVHDPHKTVNVSVQMILVKIIDLDEHAGVLDLTGWIHKSWKDEQLTWKPEEFGGVKVLRIPTEKIWTPDMVLYNNADTSYEYVVDKLAEVDYTGKVTWIPHARLKAHCNLDLKMFPFDSQTCMLSFGSWTYDITKVNFSIPDKPERRHVYDGHEWKVTSYTINVHNWGYSDDPKLDETYPVISIHLAMQRQGAFYISLLVTPAVLLALLVTFIFMIPPGSHQRLPFSIGLLICQTLLLVMLENFVPTEIGTLPIIGVHVVMQMVILTIGIILSIVILNCFHRDVKRNKVPTWLRRLLLGKLSRALCMKPDAYTSIPTDLSVVNGTSSELRTADELGLDGPTSIHPATVDSTLEDIRRYLKTLAARSSEPVLPSMGFRPHQELVEAEWKQVALVLDRMLFVVYFLFTVIVTAGLFSH